MLLARGEGDHEGEGPPLRRGEDSFREKNTTVKGRCLEPAQTVPGLQTGLLEIVATMRVQQLVVLIRHRAVTVPQWRSWRSMPSQASLPPPSLPSTSCSAPLYDRSLQTLRPRHHFLHRPFLPLRIPGRAFCFSQLLALLDTPAHELLLPQLAVFDAIFILRGALAAPVHRKAR